MTTGGVSTNLLPPVQAAPRRMLDRYELIAEIARGGMGTVLLARLAGAGGFKRLFAIKLLHGHLAADQQFVHMLLDEARMASGIHHSNTIPIVDVCESALGLYVVMDYVEGFPFGKLLGAPELTPRERIRVGCQVLIGVLDGLEAAHDLTDDDGNPIGLVHRDVSPSNVLLGLDGVGRILDFGVAHAGSRITHTDPGTIKGKLAYMAPEQARGERVDRRADVFAVGVMLWECLTGRRLFKAETDAATLTRLLTDEVLAPSTLAPGLVPPELDAVVLRALDRNQATRYQSARELARDLHRAGEKCGLMATASETAELLQTRFTDEVKERRQAIRAYCAMLAGGSGPIRVGEAPTLPRLSDRRQNIMAAVTPTPTSSVVSSVADMQIVGEGSGPTPTPTPTPTPSESLPGAMSQAAAAGVRELETRAQRRQTSPTPVPALSLSDVSLQPKRGKGPFIGLAVALVVAAAAAGAGKFLGARRTPVAVPVMATGVRLDSVPPPSAPNAAAANVPTADVHAPSATAPAAAPGVGGNGASATPDPAAAAPNAAAPHAAAPNAAAHDPNASAHQPFAAHEPNAAAPAKRKLDGARRVRPATAPAVPVAAPGRAASRPSSGGDEPTLEMNPYLHR